MESEFFRYFKRGMLPIILFEVMKSFLEERPFFKTGVKKMNIQVLKNLTLYSYNLREEFDKSGEAICEEIIKHPSVVEEYRKYCDELYDKALAEARKYGAIETDDSNELIEIFKTFSDYMINIGGTVIPERLYVEKKVKALLLALKGLPYIDKSNIYSYITDLCLNNTPSLMRKEQEDLLNIASKYIFNSGFKEKIIKIYENLKESIENKKIEKEKLKPPYFGGASFEELYIMKQITNLLKSCPEEYKNFEEHVYNYAWLEKDFGIGRTIPKKEFEGKLLKYLFADPILTLKKLNLDYVYWKAVQENAFDKFKENQDFEEKIKPLCKFLSTEAHVRLKRRFIIAALYHYLEKHLRKFIEIYNTTYRNKLSESNLPYLKIDEITDFLNTKKPLDLAELKGRATAIVIDGSLKEPELIGEEALKYVEDMKRDGKIKIPKIDRKFLKKLVTEKKATFKGATRGFYGKIKGQVRVLEPQQIFAGRENVPIELLKYKAINPGEILVTTMITPSLVTLIAGVVRGAITEEGTITSHAVTLSHEFRIPLITDVEDVTDFFRTGDTIEVDFGNAIFTVKELKEEEK